MQSISLTEMTLLATWPLASGVDSTTETKNIIKWLDNVFHKTPRAGQDQKSVASYEYDQGLTSSKAHANL